MRNPPARRHPSPAAALALLTLLLPAQARGDTLAGVGFVPPAGFQRQDAPGLVKFQRVDGQTFWAIALYAPVPGAGDPRRDFDEAWRDIAVRSLSAGPATPACSPGTNGWASCVGAAQVEQSMGPVTAVLAVLSSARSSVAILCLSTPGAEAAPFQRFVGGLVLPGAAEGPARPSPPPPPTVAARTSSGGSAALVGVWFAGAPFGPKLYNIYAGNLVGYSGGTGRQLEFEPNGRHAFSSMMESTVGGCTNRFANLSSGTWAVRGDQLEVEYTDGEGVSSLGCGGAEKKTRGRRGPSTYRYEIVSDNGATRLRLYDGAELWGSFTKSE